MHRGSVATRQTVAAPAWSPAALPSLVGWWDASDVASITADGTGLVLAWADKSGNGRTITNYDSGPPKTGIRTQNGRNAFDFPASGGGLRYTGLTVNQPCTLWVAYQVDARISGESRLFESTNTPRALYDASFGGGRIMQAGGSVVSFGAWSALPEQVVAAYNGASSQLWVNGASLGTGNPGTSGFVNAWNLGGTTSAKTFDGGLFEMALTSAAPSAGDVASWTAYIAAKWGLPSWTPAALPGLVGWWDASDPATITATAGRVSQWSNKVGTLHATQPTASDQPATGRTMNGRAALAFNGTNYQIWIPDAVASGAAAGTIVYVAQLNSDPPIGDSQSGSPVGKWGSHGASGHFPYTDGNIYDGFGSTIRYTAGNPSTSMADRPVVVSIVSAPNDWRMYINGTLLYATAANVVSWMQPSFGNSGVFFDGRLSEVLFCRAALSDVDRVAAETYLTDRWVNPPAGWTPAALPSVVGWYDASDLASVTSSGGKVSALADKGPAGNHLTAAGALQPSTGGTIGGRHAINFAGIEELKRAGTPTIRSVFAVVYQASPGTFPSVPVGSGTMAWFYVNAATDNVSVFDGAVTQRSTGTITVPTAFTASAVHRGASSTIMQQGIYKSLAMTDVNPGTQIILGGGFQGAIGEIILSSVAIDDAYLVESYLRNKWGIW